MEMKRWIVPGFVMLLSAIVSAQSLPKVTSGTLERIESFQSRHVDPRHIDIWLPDGYGPGKRYKVLYMHDGQMLFDAATTWNKQSWGVDVTMGRLINENRIPDTIVVGIWNNNALRHAEYFPEKFLPFLAEPVRTQFIREALKGRARADAYLRFLVEELKPVIDAKYLTRTEAASTFIMGSSMGGLISIYAMNEYPEVFGGAAGLSTHWPGAGKPNAALPLAAYNYLRDHLAPPENHRLYMDYGTIELDALYGVYQAFVDEIVRDRGYTEANWLSRRFDGQGHNENAWAGRLDIPLVFLMGRR